MLLNERIAIAQTTVNSLSAELKTAKAELRKLQRTQAKVEALEATIAQTKAELAEVLTPDLVQETLVGALGVAVAPSPSSYMEWEPGMIEPPAAETSTDSDAWADIEIEDDEPVAPPSLDAASPVNVPKLNAQAEAEKKAAKLSQIAVEAATITVHWLTENTGITIDAEGIERAFSVDNWASMEPTFSLMTRAGKEIKSTWKNPGIESSRHFFALQKSLHRHFLGTIEAAGFKLDKVDSETNARAYDAYCNGKRIGRIEEGLFGNWTHNLQRGFYRPAPRRNIIECLENLRQAFSEKQAENIKFIDENIALAESMLNRVR